VFPNLIAVISAPGAPMAIYPESEGDKERGKVNHIGTGPFKFAEFKPDSHVKLVRNDDYSANTNYQKRDGFGGKKTAYFDSVTIRFIPEGGARTAAPKPAKSKPSTSCRRPLQNGSRAMPGSRSMRLPPGF